MNTDEINEKDENFWQIALNKDSIPGYLKYLRLMPNGKYVNEANIKLSDYYIEKEQKLNEEWEKVLSSNSYYKVLQFTKNYPDSKYEPEYEYKLKEREHLKLKEDERMKQELEEIEENDVEGFFGLERRGIKAGIFGGIIMISIAVVWFFAGYMAGRIFLYPPILLIIGLFALIKGIIQRNFRGKKIKNI
jgi:hypothetical protein